jgi:hypothetical protein
MEQYFSHLTNFGKLMPNPITTCALSVLGVVGETGIGGVGD